MTEKKHKLIPTSIGPATVAQKVPIKNLKIFHKTKFAPGPGMEEGDYIPVPHTQRLAQITNENKKTAEVTIFNGDGTKTLTEFNVHYELEDTNNTWVKILRNDESELRTLYPADLLCDDSQYGELFEKVTKFAAGQHDETTRLGLVVFHANRIARHANEQLANANRTEATWGK